MAPMRCAGFGAKPTNGSLWRQLWIALAEAQQSAGLVSRAQVDDLRAHAAAIDVDRALEIEAEIHHDLMAEVKNLCRAMPRWRRNHPPGRNLDGY